MFKKIFKKTIKLEPQEEKDLEAVKLWEVRWNRRYGHYNCDYEPVVEVFTNEEDAVEFYNALIKATKLLRYDEVINLKLVKPK